MPPSARCTTRRASQDSGACSPPIGVTPQPSGPRVTELSCRRAVLARVDHTPTLGAKELRMLAEADERAQAAPLARILVVDDEQRILRFVVRGLRAEGYEVDSADTGADGLHKALRD